MDLRKLEQERERKKRDNDKRGEKLAPIFCFTSNKINDNASFQDITLINPKIRNLRMDFEIKHDS